jgi:glutathione S-transferase
MSESIILYGTPHSLYTGRARAYLRKHGIPFNERMPGDSRFASEILPVIKRIIIPVVELNDGTIIQDSLAIINYFEHSGQSKFSVYPDSPIALLSSLILDLFGSEGLLKPAMHYRWSYFEENKPLLRAEFGDCVAPAAGEEITKLVAAQAMAPMQGYLPPLGINDDSIPAIEAHYLELLELLQKHLLDHPYLLGGLPSVADYGFYGPLYGHLSRDIYPSQLMKQKAPRLFRWTERMSAENADMPEYGEYRFSQNYFQDDQMPQTLLDILSFVARDYLPELEETVKATNSWLTANPNIQSGAGVTKKPHQQTLGKIQFEFRGMQCDGVNKPYRLSLIQRITDAYDALNKENRRVCREFFAPLGLEKLLTLKAHRRIERADNLEVWGATNKLATEDQSL